MAERALVTGGFFLFSGSVLLLCVRRKRDRHRLWRQRVTLKKISKTCVRPLNLPNYARMMPLINANAVNDASSDLGHCFGIDIGALVASWTD